MRTYLASIRDAVQRVGPPFQIQLVITNRNSVFTSLIIMHINTVNINIHNGVLSLDKALLESIILKYTLKSSVAPSVSAAHPPKIGEPWPGIDGIYAGVSRGKGDQPDGHIVLLNAMPDGDLNWSATVKWAESLGNGARLPTRFESALLYANLRDKLDTGRWHWTGTQYSESSAWLQYFNDGDQSYGNKSSEARARAICVLYHSNY